MLVRTFRRTTRRWAWSAQKMNQKLKKGMTSFFVEIIPYCYCDIVFSSNWLFYRKRKRQELFCVFFVIASQKMRRVQKPPTPLVCAAHDSLCQHREKKSYSSMCSSKKYFVHTNAANTEDSLSKHRMCSPKTAQRSALPSDVFRGSSTKGRLAFTCLPPDFGTHFRFVQY